MRKIGLFGGTFNPIHFGHLRAAEEVHDFFQLEGVIFIPSLQPPHKKLGEILPAPVRVEMVHLAIAGNPRFCLSEVEMQRPGKSYSVETITHFREQFGSNSQLYFIMGLDAFLEINTWKQYTDLFGLCNFIILSRPGMEKKFSLDHLPVELAKNFCYDCDRAGYSHGSGYAIYPLEITALDISSTRIRENIRQGYSIKYLLPGAVEEYIKKNRLFRP